jgi:hypothetical protein
MYVATASVRVRDYGTSSFAPKVVIISIYSIYVAKFSNGRVGIFSLPACLKSL